MAYVEGEPNVENIRNPENTDSDFRTPFSSPIPERFYVLPLA